MATPCCANAIAAWNYLASELRVQGSRSTFVHAVAATPIDFPCKCVGHHSGGGTPSPTLPTRHPTLRPSSAADLGALCANREGKPRLSFKKTPHAASLLACVYEYCHIGCRMEGNASYSEPCASLHSHGQPNCPAKLDENGKLRHSVSSPLQPYIFGKRHALLRSSNDKVVPRLKACVLSPICTSWTQSLALRTPGASSAMTRHRQPPLACTLVRRCRRSAGALASRAAPEQLFWLAANCQLWSWTVGLGRPKARVAVRRSLG